MSEIIHWRQLTPKQRDALVAEKVIKQRIHVEPAGETGYDLAMVVHDAAGIARIEVIPPYTQSLDAAWPVLLSAAYHMTSEKSSSLQRLAHELFNCGMIDDLHDLNPYWVLGIMQGWTPEVLCIACLRACGCEVIV